MGEAAKQKTDLGMERPGRPLALLTVLFASAFVAAFNENIVNVGLVDIMAEFGIGAATVQWLVTGYMIMTTLVVSIVAFLQRRFSLRTLFFAACAVLIVGALVDLMAPTFPLLLAFRLLQAVGTGIFVPVMMSTVLMLAPHNKVGTFLAVGSSCITLGPALGPVASGVAVTLFGWRSMFALPLVAMVVILAAGIFFVKPIAPTQRIHLDVPSVVLLAVGLTLAVYGLLVVTTQLIVALACLLVGVAALAAFALRQAHLEEPVLDLSPLRVPQFALACVLVVVSMMTTFSLSVLLPLYFEGACAQTALSAGLLMLSPILLNAATAILGGRILDKHGEKVLLPAGFATMVAGLLLCSLVAEGAEAIPMVAASCVPYLAVGLVMSPSQTAGLKQIPAEQHVSGVAIMNTFIQLAASIGPSLFIGILSSTHAAQVAAGSSDALAQAAGFAAASRVAAVIAVAGIACAVLFVMLGKRGHAQDAARTHAMPTLASVMKRDAYTISNKSSVHEAVKTMLEYDTSGLPVVDHSGVVVGFISDGDILKGLAGARQTDLAY
ncbi:MAG: MFS transporter, partial [Eggerthellaceae bacterium]|nr:MFS transporter [Eggerthellaceae bacterium]